MSHINRSLASYCGQNKTKTPACNYKKGCQNTTACFPLPSKMLHAIIGFGPTRIRTHLECFQAVHWKQCTTCWYEISISCSNVIYKQPNIHEKSLKKKKKKRPKAKSTQHKTPWLIEKKKTQRRATIDTSMYIFVLHEVLPLRTTSTMTITNQAATKAFLHAAAHLSNLLAASYVPHPHHTVRRARQDRVGILPPPRLCHHPRGLGSIITVRKYGNLTGEGTKERAGSQEETPKCSWLRGCRKLCHRSRYRLGRLLLQVLNINSAVWYHR